MRIKMQMQMQCQFLIRNRIAFASMQIAKISRIAR